MFGVVESTLYKMKNEHAQTKGEAAIATPGIKLAKGAPFVEVT